MKKEIQTVAIIGGGPAGAILGAYLAKAGIKAGIFHIPQRPELIVGESQLPSIMPMIQELGLEETISEFSIFKPGATIIPDEGEVLSFDFKKAKGQFPSYSYNTPRNLFDDALLSRAQELGAKVFHRRAKLVQKGIDGSVALSPDTLEAIDGYFEGQPDFIVDTGGRTRSIARLLNLPTEAGNRKDVALFAHMEEVELTRPGDIHVDRYDYGWGWRIPLPGKVSVGIVVNPTHLNTFGNNSSDQFDSFLKSDRRLRSYTRNAKRISGVMKYTNYQLITQKLYGPNWALAGDAAGFVDPVFSTGVHMAMKGSKMLSETLLQNKPLSWRNFEADYLKELNTWKKISELWYDGRLFTLFRVGHNGKKGMISDWINAFMMKHVTRVFSGEASDSVFSRNVMLFMSDYGIRGQQNFTPEQLMIK